jgi:hypothetical protein
MVSSNLILLFFCFVIRFNNNIFLVLLRALPWLRRLIAGLSQRRNGLVHVGFVVDKVVLEQVFLRVLRISPVSIIRPLIHIHILSGRWTARSLVAVIQRRSHPIDINKYCSLPRRCGWQFSSLIMMQQIQCSYVLHKNNSANVGFLNRAETIWLHFEVYEWVIQLAVTPKFAYVYTSVYMFVYALIFMYICKAKHKRPVGYFWTGIGYRNLCRLHKAWELHLVGVRDIRFHFSS